MPAAVVLPVQQGTDAWLEARRSGIGSSDAPVVAGEKGSLVALWGEKTGLVPRPEPDEELAERFAWGHRMEPMVAAAYTEQTGRPLRRRTHLLRHPQVPWALASLDRESARRGERRICEIKVSDIDAKYAGEDLPGDVFAQVQHQLWVTGYEVADVVVLLRYWRLKVFEVGRDDAYLDDLIYLERDLWEHYVEPRVMPPVDGSETTRRVLGRMWGRTNGLFIPPAVDLDILAEEWRQARLELKTAEAREGTAANAIRAVIGDADGISLSSGDAITWRRNADGSRTDWKAVAEELRDRLEVKPEHWRDAVDANTKPTEGARVLRAPRSWSKEDAAA
jgi:putative phage-type endonuclease